MAARKLFHYKGRQHPLVVEMIVWALTVPTSDRPHGLKYRLYCGRDGECIVRYDNERGKGDHCHRASDELPYEFESLEKLIADFKHDCAHLAGWKWEK